MTRPSQTADSDTSAYRLLKPNPCPFCYLELVRTDTALEYRLKPQLRQSAHALLWLTACAMSVLTVLLFQSGQWLQYGLWLLFGAVLAGALLRFLNRNTRRRPIFDLTQGAYYRGRRQADGAEAPSDRPDFTRFREIAGIQLLQQRIEPRSEEDGEAYLCYEMNLVRRDGSRVSVLSHAVRNTMLEDAGTIAAVLHVPVTGELSPTVVTLK